jgi:aryl-alcohol dehydrogenase-like predicted oxidoreductase
MAKGNAATLPRREYGKTGIQLSVIGLGGILVMNEEQDVANRLVAEAVERGVNYFDVAPTYGNAEERLGPALEPYRKNVFLACKTIERGKEKAEAMLSRSLERLRTDHVDLYQFHGFCEPKEVDRVFAKGGAMEVFLEAKRSGRARFLGFSTHSIEAALLAMDRCDFDSVLFPVNFATYTKGNFGPQIMEKALAKGMGRMALKALCRQPWPEGDPDRKRYGGKCWYKPITDRHEADLALRWSLGLPITAAIPPGVPEIFRMAMDVAMNLKPLSADEQAELDALAESVQPLFTAP